MTRDEMKDRISMALKAPMLQQGFEIICKENAKLKNQLFTLRNERNAFLAQNEQYEKDLIDFNENLTKAKEFLNEFMRISKASDEDFEHDYSELVGETDRFLKEVSE